MCRLILILIISTLTSCSGMEMKKLEIALNDVTQKTALEITTKYHDMELIGTGGSISDDFINHETMVFNIHRKISKKEGVNLINEIAISYIKNVYSDERLSTYLDKNTFDIKNLKIKLHPYSPEGEDVFHPDIAFFNLEDGVFCFMTINESRKGFASREEISYEEALLLLNPDIK